MILINDYKRCTINVFRSCRPRCVLSDCRWEADFDRTLPLLSSSGHPPWPLTKMESVLHCEYSNRKIRSISRPLLLRNVISHFNGLNLTVIGPTFKCDHRLRDE